MQSEKREEFRAITAARSYSFCEIDSGKGYTVTNKNAFLDMMSGAFSGKTGFTGNAGYCYVGALTRENRTYIVALLACGWPNNRNYKWADSRKLMQYGIDNFEKVSLDCIQIDMDKIGAIFVKNGQGSFIGEQTYTGIQLGTVKGVTELLIAKGEEVKVNYRVKRQMTAPVEAGTYIGKIEITVDGEVLRAYEILTADLIREIDFSWCVKMVWKIFLNGI